MPTTEIFVANCPYDSTEDDVKAFLSQAPGVIVSRVRLKYDLSGKSRGYGFANVFYEGDDPEAPIRHVFGKSMSGKDGKPREITVALSKPKRRDDPGPYQGPR